MAIPACPPEPKDPKKASWLAPGVDPFSPTIDLGDLTDCSPGGYVELSEDPEPPESWCD